MPPHRSASYYTEPLHHPYERATSFRQPHEKATSLHYSYEIAISRDDVNDPPDHILASCHVPLYTPLSLEDNQIRLLRLYSSKRWGDEVEISLFTVSLHDPDRPSYQALSYVWGDSENTFPIRVNGYYKHYVTTNLLEALRALRFRKSSRYLWIDALCINQKDIKERNQQVKLMSEIYRNPSSVIAWLGPGGDITDKREADTLTHYKDYEMSRITLHESLYDNDEYPALIDAGLVTLEQVYSTLHIKCKVPSASMSLSTSFRYLHFLACLWISYNNAGWSIDSSSLKCFLEQLDKLLGPIICAKWWQRLWTVQESILPDDLFLMCGPYTVSWSVAVMARVTLINLFPSIDEFYILSLFCRTVSTIERYRVSCGRDAATSHHASLQDSGPRRDPPHISIKTLHMLFRDFQPRHATDPKDKIFGLLGLLPADMGTSIMEPDYRLSTSQTYQYAACSVINLSQDLNFLPNCSAAISWPPSAEFPTWLPNWANGSASRKSWVVLRIKPTVKKIEVGAFGQHDISLPGYDGHLDLYRDAVLQLEAYKTGIVAHMHYGDEPQVSEVDEIKADDWEKDSWELYEWREPDEFEPDNWEPDGTQPDGYDPEADCDQATDEPPYMPEDFPGMIGPIAGWIYSPIPIQKGDELFFLKTRSDPVILRPMENIRPQTNIRPESHWPESYHNVVLEPSLRPLGPQYYAWLGDFNPQEGTFGTQWAERGEEQVIFLQ